MSFLALRVSEMLSCVTLLSQQALLPEALKMVVFNIVHLFPCARTRDENSDVNDIPEVFAPSF